MFQCGWIFKRRSLFPAGLKHIISLAINLMSIYTLGHNFFSSFPLKINAITSVLSLFVLVFVPHLIKRDSVVKKLKKSSKPYTIATSRASTIAASDQSPEGVFIAKCVSCHTNLWEAFTYFSATIAFCLIVHMKSSVVDGFAGFFLLTRVLYTFVYLSNLNGPLRSLVWFTGLFGVIFMLAYAAHLLERD